MRLPRVLGTMVAALLVAAAGSAAAVGSAHADPVEPVSRLIAAGVPVDVAVLVPFAAPAAATATVPLSSGGFPGVGLDAVIDRQAGTVTVIQRWLDYQPSRLTVGWVNLANGRSGVSTFSRTLPGKVPGTSYPTLDRAALLRTGTGPVAIVVYGEVPGTVALIGLSSEAYGYLTPIVRLLQV
ncbi:hypothetical protein OG579_21085 [Williamsia herbipolensis]|uniref:Secreted protein n=1 Tax=Williamsia herbipolensis TaxID=1603258 RepID=A0AAU4K264_9NOCA|nr:hypothetical protein [Williamsia herbipolensis]